MADRPVAFDKASATRIGAATRWVEAQVQSQDPRQRKRAVLGGRLGCYYCQPSSTIAAATGSWPTQTPGTGTYDVYQDQGGALVKVDGSPFTIQNFYKASIAANKVVVVTPNGFGQWNADAQSCT